VPRSSLPRRGQQHPRDGTDHRSGKNTVTRLLVNLGAACAEYRDATLRDLPCRTIECDDIWAFCYAKQKNVPE
jgi:hypothetical protein